MAFPVDVDGTWVDSGASYTAGELRRADAALFASAGVARGLTVTVDGSDVVTVQPGSVVISGEDAVVGTGVYRAGIATAATGSLTARNATNARIDLVVFRQLDTDVVGSHAARTARIEIIAGTPSATPVVPTRPTMAVELARITVPASGGGTATVDSSQRTVAAAVGVDASDTGWTNLTVVSPFSTSGSAPARYRVFRGVVYFDGVLIRSSGSSTTYTTATTVPAGARPQNNRYANATTNVASTNCAVVLLPTGEIQVYMSGATSAFMPIAGLGGFPL